MLIFLTSGNVPTPTCFHLARAAGIKNVINNVFRALHRGGLKGAMEVEMYTCNSCKLLKSMC